MKKHLLLLLTTLLPLVANAQTKVEINGIWYNLVSKAKLAEVTFKGDSYDSYDDEYSGSITLPATVTHNGVAYSVTSIGDRAFYECRSLTDITIPESVTSIGDGAFEYCRSLTDITIPEGVTCIGNCAFESCSSLIAITIPEGVTSIEYEAFFGCNSLTAVHISSLEAWCNIDFGSSYANPLCYAKNLYINGELVTELAIPNSVTAVKDYAFSNCTSLTSITIPEGVTSIGGGAFYECSRLATITIPEGVTSIGSLAFSGCSSLTAITIPENVTSIESGAFQGCSSLTDITIPEGVTSIGYEAFQSCSSLTTITLPKSVGYIYSKAFAGCPELRDVYCYAERVPRTEADAFHGSYPEYATLHVPASAINSYKSTAPWSSFGTIKTIENVTLEKCATPTISYVDGKVVFACDTEGAIVKSSVKEDIEGNYDDMAFDLIPTYTLTAYATKANYEDSDEVTLTLCWVPSNKGNEDNGILTIPSKPVLISTQGGTITVSGLAAGTAVAAYSTAGTSLATATATDGTATLATNLEAGSIAIVKIGDYSIKVAIK